MSRKDVLREMEVAISLIASESKMSEIKLSKEEYKNVVAIREYCNQIIEEELWK